MNRKDLIAVAGVAIASAAITLAAFWPSDLEADSGQLMTAKIVTPKLSSNGVDMMLTNVESETYRTGEMPTFHLKAVNTTDKDVEMSAQLAMTSMSLAEQVGRMGPMETVIWNCQQPLKLKPHETVVVTVTADKALPAGSIVNVALQAGGAPAPIPSQAQRVRGRPFGITLLTFVPQAAPAGAVAGR